MNEDISPIPQPHRGDSEHLDVTLFNSGPAVAPSSPISWLPVELLQDIFQYYMCGDADLPETLLFVCRRWRDAAISFPALWSNIDPTSPRINPKWAVQFIRVRCRRSYPLPLDLDLGLDLDLDSIIDTPTLLDRCTSIHIRSPQQWKTFHSRLPRLERLVLSCTIPEGNWKGIPTLRILKLERISGIGGIWAIPLLENIVQLEAIFGPSLWRDMKKAATFVPNIQVLRLSIVGFSASQSVLENFFLSLLRPHAVQERTFNQVIHLVLHYANTNPEHKFSHPLPDVGVPCLVHLEILLYHLRTVHGLLTIGYPSITRLTVTMLADPSMNIAGDPADTQVLLDLMRRLPNLKDADLTVTPLIIATLRAEVERNPALYPLSTIQHHLPTP